MHANAFVRAFMRVPIKSVANKNETKLNQRDNNWMHKHIEQSYEKPTGIIFFFYSLFLFFDIANPCTRKLELERPRIYIHIHTYIHIHQTKKKQSEKKMLAFTWFFDYKIICVLHKLFITAIIVGFCSLFLGVAYLQSVVCHIEQNTFFCFSRW